MFHLYLGDALAAQSNCTRFALNLEIINFDCGEIFMTRTNELFKSDSTNTRRVEVDSEVMATVFYVIGGQQRAPRSLAENDQQWYEYKQGMLLEVDTKTEEVQQRLTYTSRPGSYAEGDPVLFKSATLEDGHLYTCTQTEVIVYSVPEFKEVGYVSLPCFNDVHHVRPTPDGNLLIANTGLEMILEVTYNGQVLREWNVLGDEPWANFSKEIDYRQGVNLKPHRAHPNYVFYVGDEIWATRFEQRDALCVTDPSKRIHIGLERVHDGVLHNGLIYFTSVNGNIVIANPETLQVEETIDLTTMHSPDTLLGWCRSIYIAEDKAWVGFSRVRPTKFRGALSWVRVGFQRSLPTHIACYDLKNRVCLQEINLEDYDLNAVFGIYPVPNGEV